jgi:type IV pilus assembly protein PilM
MSDAPASLTVQCQNCSTENSGGKDFCTECGTSLWLDCPSCGQRVSVSEKFCGKCGSNIRSWFEDEASKVHERIESLKDFQKKGDFAEAMRICRTVMSSPPERFAKEIEFARQRLADLQGLHERAEIRVEQDFKVAKEKFDLKEFESVHELLLKIPEPLKTEEVQTLIKSCQNALREIQQLRVELPELMKSKPIEAFPLIAKLLVMQPSDLKYRKVGEQLRDQICKKASAYLEAERFADAAKFVRRIPEEFETEWVQKIKTRCEEALWIEGYLKRSPIVDENLVACSLRFAQMASKNPRAKGWVDEANRRWQDSRQSQVIANWASAKTPPLVGSSLAVFQPLKGFAEGDFKVPGGSFAHQRLSVALGLALQAVGMGTIDRLFSGEKKGLISKLGLKSKPPAEAWGIDIGVASIKAVKVARRGEEVSIQDVRLMELPVAAPQTRSDIEEREAVRGALTKLRDDAAMKREPCLFSIGSSQVLARFMRFPSVDEKKFVAMVESEAQHSIPFPLSDVEWYWHRFSTLDSGSVPVAVLTARKEQINERLQLLKLLDFNVTGLQCDSVALFQLLRFQHQKGEGSAPETPQVLVDIGAESTQLVLVNQDRFWFRSTSHGGSQLTTAISRALKLPFHEAEKVKLQPFGSKELLTLGESLKKPIQDMVGEIDRSCSASKKEGFVVDEASLFVTGGGVRSLGLMQALAFPGEGAEVEG